MVLVNNMLLYEMERKRKNSETCLNSVMQIAKIWLLRKVIKSCFTAGAIVVKYIGYFHSGWT